MVGLGLVVAACGSDGATGDDASPATSAAGGTGDEAAPEATAAADGETTDTAGTTAGEDGAASDGAALAAARVDAFRQPVTELPLSAPIAIEPGTKVFYVQCGVSACSEIAVGVEAAAAAAGWEYETASHQDTPDTVASVRRRIIH